ncbi:MAG: hypothetical protein LQ348_000323 [Seirophora lacunosa]|nr:MAG: hypothetical protein LQ348_000323 [Seirophora lacunosa]
MRNLHCGWSTNGKPFATESGLGESHKTLMQEWVAHRGQGFTAVHLGAIVATLWVLMLNGIVGFQLLDDGTPLSLGLIMLSAAALFIGTGYIALDTAFTYSGRFESSLSGDHRNIGLYVLYQLAPLVFLAAFFVLETVLVLKVLGEKKPMRKLHTELHGGLDADGSCTVYLIGAALLFALGQIFQYVVSTHICQGTNGAINGALFQTLFTLLAVVMTWVFWSSITEDDWPMPVTGGTYT